MDGPDLDRPAIGGGERCETEEGGAGIAPPLSFRRSLLLSLDKGLRGAAARPPGHPCHPPDGFSRESDTFWVDRNCGAAANLAARRAQSNRRPCPTRARSLLFFPRTRTTTPAPACAAPSPIYLPRCHILLTTRAGVGGRGLAGLARGGRSAGRGRGEWGIHFFSVFKKEGAQGEGKPGPSWVGGGGWAGDRGDRETGRRRGGAASRAAGVGRAGGRTRKKKMRVRGQGELPPNRGRKGGLPAAHKRPPHSPPPIFAGRERGGERRYAPL